MTEPIYDLAFSFLTPDYQVAADLHRLLSPTHSGFLYTEQQKTLAGPDGYGKFAAVFSEQARLVVLVYREGWGERGFTGIECTAIKRRIHREGAGFLFVIVADTEPRPKVPDWLPVDHVYWDLPTFGIDDAADAIRQRLRRVGGVRKVETAAEMAVRQKRERAAANDRDRFRQTERREAARTELRTIFQALSEIAAASGGVLTEPTWNNVQTVITFAPIEGRPKLTFALQTASVRTARDPDLHVKMWRDAIVTDFHIPGVQTSPMYKAEYEIDRDEAGLVGWRSVRAGETTALSSYDVAQREVKELLARRASMGPR